MGTTIYFYASPLLSKNSKDLLFEIKFKRYVEVTKIIEKMPLPKNYDGKFKLPSKYKDLSKSGEVYIRKQNDLLNISFPEKSGLLKGTLYVYSNKKLYFLR